jgi:mRNA interferase YafQ
LLQPSYTRQFERDLKRMKKRGKDPRHLRGILQRLIAQEPLEPRYRDHKLIGNYKGRRECHIQPDWLLIYKIEGNSILFERTGTHSDLFR